MTDHPTWTDILDEPFVALILGARGSGKTSLGHRLMEVFVSENGDREAYIMGFPKSQMDLLPDYINHLHVDTPFEDWPDEAIILVTEAHHLIHSRRSMQDENLDIDRLVTLSRQKDLDIVLDTQYARRLDVTGIMGANALIFRYPSLLQEDFERRQLRKFVSEAKEALNEYVRSEDNGNYVMREFTDELMKHAYIFSERFRGVYPHEIELAGWWSEEISKAIGQAEKDAGSGGAVKAFPDELSDMPEGMSLEEAEELLEKWDQLRGAGVQLTEEGEEDEEGEEEQGEAEIPTDGVAVQINEEFAQRLDENEVLSLDKGLQVHFDEEDREAVHNAIAETMGVIPDNLYDASRESDIEGFELHRTFDLSRNSVGDPWVNRRFDPSELVENINEIDPEGILILSNAAPIA